MFSDIHLWWFVLPLSHCSSCLVELAVRRVGLDTGYVNIEVKWAHILEVELRQAQEQCLLAINGNIWSRLLRGIYNSFQSMYNSLQFSQLMTTIDFASCFKELAVQ